MKKIKQFFGDQRGSTGSILLACVLVILLALSVVLEIGHAFMISTNVKSELSRAVNSAVAMAMKDSFRREHLSQMEEALAQSGFQNYLANEMSLSNNARIADDKTVYSITIDSQVITISPPRMEIKGNVSIPLLFFGELVQQDIVFPYSIASRNQRLDDYTETILIP